MKIDYLSCTKMVYFAEKILRDNYHVLPAIDSNFAKQLGMSMEEIKVIIDQFEHDKLLAWIDFAFEVEDNKYSNDMTSEGSCDALTVDKTKTEELIRHLKERYVLRRTPYISREAIVSVTDQIKQTLNEDGWMKIVYKTSIGYNMLSDKQYTLTDFLFRHAYDSHKESFPLILAEFLNPIYYGIDTKEKAQKLFEYIDKILLAHASKIDYKNWLRESAKFIATRETTLSKEIHEKSVLNSKLYVTKKGDEYFFDGNPVYIKNLDAQYVVIFDVAYSLRPQGGKIEYSKIIDGCKKRGIKRVKNKSIQKALTGNNADLFRYVKDLKQTPAYNVDLFVAMHDGKEIDFNNKRK